MASLKTAVKSSKDIATTEKIKLNAKSEINNLKNLAERNKTKAGHAFNETIANSIKAIGLAANPKISLNHVWMQQVNVNKMI